MINNNGEVRLSLLPVEVNVVRMQFRRGIGVID